MACYGGVTVHERGKRGYRPVKLAFRGSHISVTFSPDGRFVISSMQEHMLRGWRLSDRADLRIAGYPGKVHVMHWVGTLPWLATSGAGFVVCWLLIGDEAGVLCHMPLRASQGPWRFSTSLG